MWNILSCVFDPGNTNSNKMLFLSSSSLYLMKEKKAHGHENDGC